MRAQSTFILRNKPIMVQSCSCTRLSTPAAILKKETSGLLGITISRPRILLRVSHTSISVLYWLMWVNFGLTSCGPVRALFASC